MRAMVARRPPPRDMRHRGVLPFHTYNETEMQMVAWAKAKKLAKTKAGAGAGTASHATRASRTTKTAKAAKEAENRARAHRLEKRNSKKYETDAVIEAVPVKKASVVDRNTE